MEEDNKISSGKLLKAAKEYAESMNSDLNLSRLDDINPKEFVRLAFSSACCGFGHRDYFPAEYDDALRETVRRLYKKEKVCKFYTGGMGDYDRAFASAVRSLKRDHQEVRLHLVLPYYSNRINTDKREAEYLKELYDEIYIPDFLSGIHYKSAITLRNRWMVDHSDHVISAVIYDYGGAYQAVGYAEKQGKKLINIAHHKNISERILTSD